MSTRIGRTAALLAALGSTAALAAPDAASIAAQGNGQGAAPCSSCHGPDGAGMPAAGFPRLAGLDAAYMLRQLDDFASGARDNAVMKPTAAALSEAERKALASYYSKLALPAATAAPADTSGNQLGQQLAMRGRWSEQVPACVQCHGPQGVGVGEHFPALAGQPAKYIADQLHAWQQGTRKNDPLGMMKHVAQALNDADIQAVADWFAAQPAALKPSQKASVAAAVVAVAASAPAQGTGKGFAPPLETAIPDNEFGEMIRKGRAIFVDTQGHAGKYVGNGLNCANCHLDAGRLAHSAPLWGAWVRYPAYRKKNDRVNTYAERLQGCFQFSMNGKPPPAEGDVIVALQAYSYWMATGAPTGTKMDGALYPVIAEPAQAPDYARGQKVFARDCAMCHGDNGQGQKAGGAYVFPPLWGSESFNWGAGMHRVSTAAGFIKANMPLSRGGTLSDQEAWDVALFMDSHERPQDPRFVRDVATTRKQFHDNKWSMYGKVVNGKQLGSEPLKPRR